MCYILRKKDVQGIIVVEFTCSSLFSFTLKNCGLESASKNRECVIPFNKEK
jgi:hypothetical protein